MNSRRPLPSREQLLEMMRAVADELGLRQLPQKTFLRHARVSAHAIDQHYDTWTAACDAAGVGHGRTLSEIPRQREYTKEECLAEMRRVAELLKTEALSSKVYSRYGQISTRAVVRRFRTWRDALTAAGLAPTAASQRLDLPARADCLAELQRVARAAGRDHLTTGEFTRASEMSAHRVKRVLGSWNEALEAAGLKPSPYFIQEIPLPTLADAFLRACVELGRIPTLVQLTRRSEHVSHTFGSGKPGGYPAFKRRAIGHILATEARVPLALKELFAAELAAAPPPPVTRATSAQPPHTAITKHELAQDGIVACLARKMQKWAAPPLERELDYSDALAEYLRAALPDTHIEREYRHEGTTCDIRVGLSQEEEVFVEVKYRLQRKADYDRLVGQVEGLKPRKNKVMVVLVGDTDQRLSGRLNQQFSRLLATQESGAETFMIVSAGSSAPGSG